ncbi:MAG TPA: tyrosine-protein phosphatase [Candidatus Tectomicrobia bacterium]
MQDAASSTLPRHLGLTGTYNLRDTGGYRTLDGCITRWRTLLRSDSLHRVPPLERTALLTYGVRTVIDLRRSDELHVAPNVFADTSDVVYHHVSLLADTPPDRKVAPRLLPDVYRLILDQRQEQLRQTLATLAAPGGFPAIVHCTAGKDRTGLIVALLLGLVGVPEATIVADYALSSQYLVGPYLEEAQQRAAYNGIPWAWFQHQVICPPEFMQTTLQYLDEHHGGIPAYVRHIGLSQEQCEHLRQALVD